MCYDRAKECSEGVSMIEDAHKQTCYEIYYTTGDSKEIWAFAEGMC
ncbi:MAG: hypothetical protein ACOC6P_04445 [Candidatus Aminicenantaceae bacterium]